MNGISLFTGLGILDYAAELAGIQVVAQVEIETVYHEHLKQKFPNALLYGDILKINPHEFPPADIVFGGDPCQPHSVGGKREGEADPRFLWPAMFAIIQAKRPTWVVNENVIGSISNLVLDRKISDLESAGYACQAYSLCTYATGGNNQRQRVFLVAHTNGKSGTGYCQNAGAPEADKWADKTVLAKAMENEGVLWNWEHALGRSGRVYPVPSFGRIAPMHDVASELAAIKGIGNGVNPWLAFELFRSIQIIEELSGSGQW